MHRWNTRSISQSCISIPYRRLPTYNHKQDEVYGKLYSTDLLVALSFGICIPLVQTFHLLLRHSNAPVTTPLVMPLPTLTLLPRDGVTKRHRNECQGISTKMHKLQHNNKAHLHSHKICTNPSTTAIIRIYIAQHLPSQLCNTRESPREPCSEPGSTAPGGP